MKYLLIHSYSELNKGDAGIILSTIQNIRSSDKHSKIFLYSTYGFSDKQFKSQKLFFEKYVDGIYSALFPELFIYFNNKYYYGVIAKFISLLGNLVKGFLILIFPPISKLILSSNELDSFHAIKDCDLVISKGGSFLCNEGSSREFFALLRLFHPIFVAKRLKKRVIILGQSLGPVEGFFSQILFKLGISFVNELYIRESKTIDLLLSNNIQLTNYKFIPDMAFALNDFDGIVDKEISFDNNFNVGLTIVDFPFKNTSEKDQYVTSIKNTISHLVKNYKATVFIFPQVTTKHPDGSNDMRLTKKIAGLLPLDESKKTLVLEKDYSPTDLKKMYGMMNIFIATRLHSAIFSLGNCIPTINISYHGTKSEGTFELLGMSEWVINIRLVNSEELIMKVDDLILNQNKIAEKLKISSKKLEDNVKQVVHEICNS